MRRSPPSGGEHRLSDRWTPALWRRLGLVRSPALHPAESPAEGRKRGAASVRVRPLPSVQAEGSS